MFQIIDVLRLLIADSETLFRAGLRLLLTGFARMQVIGEAEDGHELLRLAAAQPCDVVLMEVVLPHLNGLDVIGRLRRDHPAVRVVMLSNRASPAQVAQALGAGAHGFLSKRATPGELEEAIRAVANGGFYVGHRTAGKLLGTFRAFQRLDRDGNGQSLTPRQREIVQLIVEGHTSRQIASILRLSLKTVNHHRADIMARLNVHDVTGLVRWAIHTGIIDAEPL